MPPDDRDPTLPDGADARPPWQAYALLLFLVAVCPLMIARGVAGVAHRSFSYKRAHASGVGAAVFSSAAIFTGLAGLCWLWTLRRGESAALDDPSLRILLVLIAAALGGGFLIFVLSIAF